MSAERHGNVTTENPMVDPIRKVENLLISLEENHIWPNGDRYLWTDAFGLTVLTTLYEATGKQRYLDDAAHLVAEVDRVLGRPQGYRIGEAPERDGQYYHYLAMWIYALWRSSPHLEDHHDKAIGVVHDIHRAFVRPGDGVVWKMEEDLSAPYPNTGLGALDPFHGYVVYNLLDPHVLRDQIAEMKTLMEQNHRLRIEQDLGLGMMLWSSHFFPEEPWAQEQRERSLGTLNLMWHDPPGFFARDPLLPDTKFAFTNYGVALGLEAVDEWPERRSRLLTYFGTYRSGDRYDIDPITHVMRAAALCPEGFLMRGLPDALRPKP